MTHGPEEEMTARVSKRRDKKRDPAKCYLPTEFMAKTVLCYGGKKSSAAPFRGQSKQGAAGHTDKFLLVVQAQSRALIGRVGCQ